MEMSKSFSLISSINPNINSTWEENIFLTFDIDWAVDEIIEDVLSLCEPFNVPVTLYATHVSDILNQDIKRNKNIEIGLHPNFNPLLSGATSKDDFRGVCSKLKDIHPEATSVRSHSLCFGSLIQTAYAELGITHDSSIIVPYQWNTQPLFPWKMWDDLIRIPYFFCDYVTAMTSDAKVQELANRSGLKVFDFHPIHVFLNTENLDRYEKTRPLHQKPKELIKHRYKGYGTRSRLLELLQIVKNYENSDYRAN